VKDGINDAVVDGRLERVDGTRGSKAAAHVRAVVGAGESFTVQVRFCPGAKARPFAGFDATFERRRREADEFYDAVRHAPDRRRARAPLSPDEHTRGSGSSRHTAWRSSWPYCSGEPRRRAPGTVTGMATSGLLGTSNLLFWQIFIATDALAMGYVTTSLHWAAAIAQLAAAVAAAGAGASQDAGLEMAFAGRAVRTRDQA
jgi:hypothetical protein